MPDKTYIVKKGPADPFRGDWYTDEQTFVTIDKTIAAAGELTLNNYSEFENSWEEFGYEWSVFEKTDSSEIKIWEGYKYIKASQGNGNDLNAGMM